MLNIENEDRRAALRAEFDKADAEVGRTLIQDAREFKSPAELRSKLNQARALRDWASRQLAAMEHKQSH